jgi:hypothetical protein
MFAVLPTAVLFGLGELATRLHYYRLYQDFRYLILPFASTLNRQQVEYPYGAQPTYASRFDACSQREIVFTVNSAGGRGAPWSVAKPPGVLRILAVGGSSTFGVNNPDWATWPAILETRLRERLHRTVEVLNGGQGSTRLEGIVESLRASLPRYRPDIVIYYGAFNNANPVMKRIGDFHSRLIGRLTGWLYYRSALYTYLVEKAYFSIQMRGEHGVVPDIEPFRASLGDFIAVVRQHNVLPVLVLQATELPYEPPIGALALNDLVAIRATILKLAGDDPSSPSREKIGRLRAYRTQVLVEAVRKTGIDRRIQVIDPRSTLAGRSSSSRVFCDEIHLSDLGNEILADVIATHLLIQRP